MEKLFKLFILWAIKRNPHTQNIIDSDGTTRMKRYAPFWYDEWTDNNGRKHNRPPWYRPFNILVHRWLSSQEENMHDHPRWSITVLLRGQAIERTPWGEKELKPGSIIIRGRKYIHSIRIPEDHKGKTWTLFIVGRRNFLQNYYKIQGYDKEY